MKRSNKRRVRGVRPKFQALFNLPARSNFLITKYDNFLVFHYFEIVDESTKNSEHHALDISKTHDPTILLKL